MKSMLEREGSSKGAKRGFDRSLVIGTWLLLGGAALPFGCGGRSESVDASSDGSSAQGGSVGHGSGGKGGPVAYDGTMNRPAAGGGHFTDGARPVMGGSAGTPPHGDGTLFGDGRAVDGTFPEGHPLPVDGCCSDGKAEGTTWSDGGWSDGGEVFDGGGWSDGEVTDGGGSDGAPYEGWSDGTISPGSSDGAPEDGVPG